MVRGWRGLRPAVVPLLARGTVVWLLVHAAAAAAVRVQARYPGDPAGEFGVGAAVGVVALCGALGAVDVWRRREGSLLRNLGLGPDALAAVLAAPAALGEVVVGVLSRPGVWLT